MGYHLFPTQILIQVMTPWICELMLTYQLNSLMVLIPFQKLTHNAKEVINQVNRFVLFIATIFPNNFFFFSLFSLSAF